jgi:O-antigen ligase
MVAVAVLLVGVAIAFGSGTGMLVLAGQGFAVVFFAAVLLPLLFWRVPASPVIVLVVAATTIERVGEDFQDAITSRIPMFRSLQDSYGISGAIMTPIEIVIGFALFVLVARAITERRLTRRWAPLGVAVAVVLLIALLEELYGLAHHGIFNISLWELRPFVYLAITYFLASQLVTTTAALDAILWGVVIGTGLKGVIGTERVITLANVVPHPEAILEHEESFFFSIFIFLTIAMWVLGRRGKLRLVATLLLPFVVTADLGNDRRTAWLILPAIGIAFWVIVYQRMPARRKALGIVGAIVLLLGSGYIGAFGRSTSLFAQPASAIWSEFAPNPRDASSNQYRIIENQNLAQDIRESFITGTGFGVPINHPIPIFDASSVDPLINFIPHNTILYVWLRTGTLGAVAFWFMVGAAIVSACRLARHPDVQFCLFGVVGVAGMIAWLIQGRLDKGITSFRIVILVGCLMGAVEAARRLRPVEGLEREFEAEATTQVKTDQVIRPQLVPLPAGYRRLPQIRKRSSLYGRGPSGSGSG